MVLVVVIAVAAVMFVPSIPDRYVVQARDDAHAKRLCDRYAREHPVDTSNVIAQPVDLRALKTLAAQSKQDIAPWDRFDNEHFVASCSFGPAFSSFNAQTPTTVCPNGDRIILSDDVRVYVDDSGRSGPDVLDQHSLFTPCGTPRHG
jgi:hypothetical protein